MKTKKKFILLILLSLAYTGLQTQPLYSDYYINPLNTWSGVTGGVLHFNDTTYMAGIGGYNYGYNVEKAIIFLKLDGEGIPVYQKLYGEMGHEYYAGFSGCFRRVGNDHFIFTIINRNLFTNEYSSIVYYLNRNFDTIYSKEFSFDGVPSTMATNIIPANDGGYYVLGNYGPINGQAQRFDTFILKIDSTLNMLWQRLYNFSYFNQLTSLEATPDQGLLISGLVADQSIYYTIRPLIAKTDSLGNIEWFWDQGSYPHSYDDGRAVCGISSDGDYLIAYPYATYQGPPYPVPSSVKVLRVVKFNPQGNVIWSKDYGSSSIDLEVMPLIPKDDGTILIPVSRWDAQVSRWNSYILHINNEGDSLWMREYEHILDGGPAKGSQIMNINLTPSETIIAAGVVLHDSYPSLQAMWIMHLDEYGCPVADCDTTVGVKPIMAAKHTGISVYPNPASTQFFLQLPEKESLNRESELHLRIFDAKGGLVLQKNIPNGNGSIPVEIDGWLPGLYMLQVSDRNLIIGHTKLLVK
jgi:hypothetical protein